MSTLGVFVGWVLGFLGAWVLPVIPVIPLVTAVFGPVIRPVIRFARLGSLEVGWAGWLQLVSWTGVWTEAGVPSLELLELDDSQCVGWAAAAEAAPAAAVGLDRSGVGLLELVLAAPSTEPTGLVDLLGWALLGLLGGSDVVGVEDLHVLDVGVVGAAGVDPGGGGCGWCCRRSSCLGGRCCR